MASKHDTLAHQSVLLNQVIATLSPQDGAIYVDATFGAGGYSKAILESAQCRVIGLDRDRSAEAYAQVLHQQYGDRFVFVHGNFGEMQKLVWPVYQQPVTGVVMDIGVSSMQLDTPMRGFSFMNDGPLDMRMDVTQKLTAADIVARYSTEDLADLIYQYGGERKARQIAQAITKAREIVPITSTLQLASIIKNTIHHYHDSIHPATRTFQALRIEVNGELTELEQGLKEAVALLAPLGKVIVVTFHSLEDGIVKRSFAELCGKKVHMNKYKPTPTSATSSHYRALVNGVIVPEREEVIANPRARSAKLRAIERCV